MIARFAILAVSVALVGCGYEAPGDPFPDSAAHDLTLVNEYAESIFTVSVVEHPSGLTRTVFSNKRIAGFDSATVTGAIGSDATSITITATATSLGTTRSIGPMELALNSYSNVALTYDYDLATGGFRMKYGLR